MPVETNAKRIVRIMKGDTQVWSDTDTWTLLRLSSGFTGAVLFKDNGDGTAQLSGSFCGTGTCTIYPPTGYAFTATHWTAPTAFIKDTYNSNVLINPASADAVVKIVSGNLTIQSGSGYAYVFCKGRMYASVAADHATDAIPIDIKLI